MRKCCNKWREGERYGTSNFKVKYCPECGASLPETFKDNDLVLDKPELPISFSTLGLCNFSNNERMLAEKINYIIDYLKSRLSK